MDWGSHFAQTFLIDAMPARRAQDLLAAAAGGSEAGDHAEDNLDALVSGLKKAAASSPKGIHRHTRSHTYSRAHTRCCRWWWQ